MSEENNNSLLQELSSPEEIKWKALRPFLLDPREDYPEPYHMLEYNGVPFSKVGGLAAISGQKKNGKSFVLTQLMAAILGCGNEKTQQYLPGLKVPDRTIEYLREIRQDDNYLPKVLYCDTEMEKLSSAKALRRVHWLCGWDMNRGGMSPLGLPSIARLGARETPSLNHLLLLGRTCKMPCHCAVLSVWGPKQVSLLITHQGLIWLPLELFPV